MFDIAVGREFRKKKIRDVVVLSNGWYVIKTDDSKTPKDFRVKVIYQLHPRKKSRTPKHAHFAIDLYGKLCADKQKGVKVFDAIAQVWQGRKVSDALSEYGIQTTGLPGYSLEYILHALNWILDQEDINFTNRPPDKQRELDTTLAKVNVRVPPNRLGSELAMSLLCSVVLGEHPVEAFIKANLDVLPVKRARGAV
jgi:hypothetical protein